MIYDLIIIGNGIAACAALLRLKEQGLQVAVIAPSQRPSFKIGESLSPSANQELRHLGIYEAFLAEAHQKALSSFSAWSDGQIREKYIWETRQEAGWYVNRIRFEDFLWQQAKQTTFTFVDDKVLSAAYANGTWDVQTKSKKQFSSSLLLDCTGRAAVIARNFTERKRLDHLVAAYTVLTQEKNSDVEPTIGSLVEPHENGWLYSTIVPGGQMVVAYFTDTDLLPTKLSQEKEVWKRLLSSSKLTQKRIDSAEYTLASTPKITDAATIISSQPCLTSLLMAGDAAASFDPLSSHGMTTAIWSGRKSAEAAIDLLKQNEVSLYTYQKSLQEGIEQYLYDQKRIYGLEQRFSEQPFWKRRH